MKDYFKFRQELIEARGDKDSPNITVNQISKPLRFEKAPKKPTGKYPTPEILRIMQFDNPRHAKVLSAFRKSKVIHSQKMNHIKGNMVLDVSQVKAKSVNKESRHPWMYFFSITGTNFPIGVSIGPKWKVNDTEKLIDHIEFETYRNGKKWFWLEDGGFGGEEIVGIGSVWITFQGRHYVDFHQIFEDDDGAAVKVVSSHDSSGVYLKVPSKVWAENLLEKTNGRISENEGPWSKVESEWNYAPGDIEEWQVMKPPRGKSKEEFHDECEDAIDYSGADGLEELELYAEDVWHETDVSGTEIVVDESRS